MSSEYPSDSDLERIEKWDCKSFADLAPLIEFVYDRWNEHYGDAKREGRILTLVTGGWSGNESIVGAMRANYVFWSVCWVSSERGGKYVFELPEKR